MKCPGWPLYLAMTRIPRESKTMTYTLALQENDVYEFIVFIHLQLSTKALASSSLESVTRTVRKSVMLKKYLRRPMNVD